ncbi:hypothetical protein [Rhodococcus sp. YH3-3]|nr:hypothetical protein [Rhodococcus sp. YH3-3]
MNGSDKNPTSEDSDNDRAVPDKQIHRWKDDGGAVVPEATNDPQQD